MGYSQIGLSPNEYVEKLMEHNDDNKVLNEVWAYYIPECHLNLISKGSFPVIRFKYLKLAFSFSRFLQVTGIEGCLLYLFKQLK